MKRFAFTILLLTSINPFYTVAQDLVPVASSAREDSPFKVAIAFYDEGAHNQAIEVYATILKENPANVPAIAEMALTYFATKDFDKAVAFALDGLKFKSGYRPSLFLYLGNSYDMLGKSEDAIIAFRSGLSIDPTNYMLHYNLGVAHLRRNDIENARLQLQSALKAKPSHPSSNLRLGDVYRSMQKRVPAIFAYSRFLILEPNSNRSAEVASLLRSLLADSVSVKPTAPGQMAITVHPDSDAVDGDLTTLEISFAMTQAARLTGKSANLSPLACIASDFGSFLQITFELLEKDKFEGFCWKFYAPYFAALHHGGYTDVAVRYMFRSTDKDEALSFMRNNVEKGLEFTNWNVNYRWSE